MAPAGQCGWWQPHPLPQPSHPLNFAKKGSLEPRPVSRAGTFWPLDRLRPRCGLGMNHIMQEDAKNVRRNQGGEERMKLGAPKDLRISVLRAFWGRLLRAAFMLGQPVHVLPSRPVLPARLGLAVQPLFLARFRCHARPSTCPNICPSSCPSVISVSTTTPH